MHINGNEIVSAPGMVLINAEGVYAPMVTLGVNDSPENWREIPADEVEDK